MKIVFLDAKSIGDDIDLSGFDQLGEVVKYGFSTPKEAGERTRDADVVIINKVLFVFALTNFNKLFTLFYDVFWCRNFMVYHSSGIFITFVVCHFKSNLFSTPSIEYF